MIGSIRTFGAVSLMALTSSALADNLLVNSGFETGDLTAWPHSSFAGSITVNSTSAYSGGFGVKFSSVNNASMLISQDVTPTTTALIDHVSLWYKRTGSPNATPATIRLLYTDLSFTEVFTDPAATNWTFLNLTPLLATGRTLQSLQIGAAGAGQNVLFDEIIVNAIPAPGAAALGIVGLALVARRRR